jgi:hypothetical protein
LINSLALIEKGAGEGKLELATVVGELMPAGKPDLLGVIKYPMVGELIKQEGRNAMLKIVFVLVKNFCSSFNVVRNMNEDQMLEAAAMLLDECGDFRTEDYTMMFAMAKRGQLVDIRDRIDISVISKLMYEYWLIRLRAGREAQENDWRHLDTLGPTERESAAGDVAGRSLGAALDGLAGSLGYMKQAIREQREDNELRDKLKNEGL